MIIIRLRNESESGLNKRRLKFSKMGMARFSIAISWYERKKIC